MKYVHFCMHIRAGTMNTKFWSWPNESTTSDRKSNQYAFALSVHQPRHTAGGTCDSDAPARTTRSGPKKYSYNIKREIFGADLKHSFHQQLGSLWRQSVARKSTGVDEFPVYYYYQSDLSILWFPASHHHQEHNGVKLFLKSSYLNLIILKLHRYLFSWYSSITMKNHFVKTRVSRNIPSKFFWHVLG